MLDTVNRAERALGASGLIGDGDFRALFVVSPVPYLVTLPDLTIVDANDAYLAATMKTLSGIVGRSLFEVLPDNPADAEADGESALRESIGRIVRDGGTDVIPLQRYDIRNPVGQFVERYWSTSTTAVPGPGGSLAYIIYRAEDVTEYVYAARASRDQFEATQELQTRYDQTRIQSQARERALLTHVAADRDRLLDSVLAKDEFLQTISHELNSPVTTIKGNAQILIERGADLDAADFQTALRDIVAGSERLGRIVSNLLLLARPELGEAAEPEPCVIAKTADRFAAEHCIEFPDRTVQVFAEGTETAVVDCVQTYLEQVLHNLLSNAEKYSPPTAAIEIRIERRGNDVLVKVLDGGPGFTAEQVEHIFEPFYRIADDRAARPGLGIGLTVTKRLVEAMSGTIWAASRADGGGEVGFSLPVADAAY